MACECAVCALLHARLMHNWACIAHASMTASIRHHAMQPSDCLVDHCKSMRACLPWMMGCLGNWQRVHALRAMATLRGRSSVTRHTAHLAARPDRARAHVQRATVALTVLQVARACIEACMLYTACTTQFCASLRVGTASHIQECMPALDWETGLCGSKPMHCGRWQHCGDDRL